MLDLGEIGKRAQSRVGSLHVGDITLRYGKRCVEILGATSLEVDTAPWSIGVRLSRSSGEEPGLWQRMRGAKAETFLHLEIEAPGIGTIRFRAPWPAEALEGLPAAAGDFTSIDPETFGAIARSLWECNPNVRSSPSQKREPLPDELRTAASAKPSHSAYRKLLKTVETWSIDRVEAVLAELDPLLEKWPIDKLPLTWLLADNVFREKKKEAGFLLVRHVDVTGVYEDAAKLFDELLATDHPHRIRSLDLGGREKKEWRLGKSGLDRLARCSHLRTVRRLDLHRADLGPEALSTVRDLHCAPRLRYLSLAHNTLGSVATLFAEPHPFLALEELDLDSTDIGDDDLAALARLPNLRVLRVAGSPRITPAGIAALARAPFLPRLRTLAIGGSIGEGGNALAAVPGELRELVLEDARNVPVGTLAGSPLCRALETLAMRRCNLGAREVAELVRAPKTLEDLDLSDNPIGDDGARAIAGLASVETLTLDRCGITGEGLVVLVEAMPGLSSLSLIGNRIGEGLRAPARTPEALALDLSSNRLDASATTALARWPGKLRALMLSRCELDAAAIAPLAGAPILAAEALFSLDHNTFGASGMTALASKPFPKGIALFLSSCGITDSIARTMADSPSFAGVEMLRLDGNPLTSRGYAVLAASPYFAGVKDELELHAKMAERNPAAGTPREIGASVEIRTQCRRCSQPVHVNALANRVHCGSCQNDIELSWEAWAAMLKDAIQDVPKYQAGTGGRVQIVRGPAAGMTVEYARFDPYCFACKTDFDPELLREHVGKEYPCPGCKKGAFVRALPEDARSSLPSIAFLVAEDPSCFTVGDHKPAPAKAIVFACPSCGGGLKLDGTQRMVDCTFCQSSVYLPDDLWLRLHPVSTIRRWFFWFTPAPAPA